MLKKLASLLLLYSGIAGAQSSGKIIGKITGTDHSPLEATVVSLLLAEDNSFVKTQFSDQDGSFEFSGLKQSNYKISIEYLGYTKYESQSIAVAQESVSLGEINLQP